MLPLTQSREGEKSEPRVFLQTPFGELGVSRRTGTWVAYQSNESGQLQVYVAPFPGPGGKRQVSLNGGLYPRWRRNGKEIFFATADGELMAAETAARKGTLEVGRVQRMFGVATGTFVASYEVSADGQKVLTAENGSPVTTGRLTLMQNWTAALPK